nr:unnamed protein product [Callosobruchus chinensis]
MLGKRIRSHVPISSTLNKLQHALLEECDLVPQEGMCHSIFTMPRRMLAISRARGGNTCY